MTVVAEDGEKLGKVDFHTALGPQELRQEAVTAFARLCSSTGTWVRYATCEKYGNYLKRFLSFLSGLAVPPARVAEITPGIWSQWLLSGTMKEAEGHSVIRRILAKTDALPPDTRAAAEVRSRQRKASKQVEAYTLPEFKLIRSTARRTADRIERRIAAGLTLLARYRAGEFAAGSDESNVGELLDQLALTGDLDRDDDGTLTKPVQRACLKIPGGYASILKMLFPCGLEIGALAALLACEEGWNLSVVDLMDVPDFRPDGGIGDVAIHRAATLKHRRPPGRKHASNSLVDLGDGSAGHALRQVVTITAEARACMQRLGTPTSRLLVGHRAQRLGPDRSAWLIGASKSSIDGWNATLALESPHGGRLDVAAARLRRTHQALFSGPRQNTQRTHEDVYLLRNATVRAESADVIAAGLQGAVDHAATMVKMRLLKASPTPDPEELTELSEQAGMPLERVRELVKGDLDTATGACLDFEHSPFTPAGPCSASFLLCFGCDNGLATSRHLPRIIYLHDALSALRTAVDPQIWSTDWAGHYSRISDLLTSNTTDSERAALRGRLTDRDRALIDQVLDRRLDA
ncbi:hypothetical protein [Amycolatopsis keratiniphila]|uniref:hypothetical protein n=1 Tax=Amycolatopsis keratiniphila TaxID=129921 RepID=UPI00117778DC|nr:hypothetical protein [Amycolatopsis keratiniphila]